MLGLTCFWVVGVSSFHCCACSVNKFEGFRNFAISCDYTDAGEDMFIVLVSYDRGVWSF